ncbi:MAG: hypothetical protein ACK4KT_01875 [Thermaurantimonas sp.]
MKLHILSEEQYGQTQENSMNQNEIQSAHRTVNPTSYGNDSTYHRL